MKKIISILLMGVLILSGVGANVISTEIPSLHQSSSLDEYDMVIIAPSQFSSTLQPLIDHKNSVGIHTFLKTTDEIYNEYNVMDHAEHMKYYIKQVLEQYDIDYVLFIGGAEDIPGRYTHVYFDEPFDYPTPDEWVFTSDFYYADIYDSNGNFSSWDSNENEVFAEYHWN